jgi:type III pantothenate kinase
MDLRCLVAADVGNARIKLGMFPVPCAEGFPQPVRVLDLSAAQPELERIESWLAGDDRGRLAWSIASVNRPADARLTGWLSGARPSDTVTLLSAGRLPLKVRVAEPERVGIDRLVNAVAVNRLRRDDCAAVVVDAGTAITVDALSPDGAFLGGAVLPGMAISARALHDHTDLLPLVDPSQLRAQPAPLGVDTVSAIKAGLFWGAVGAIRELAARLQAAVGSPADVVLTGGAAAALAEPLGAAARYVPHLTLAGIALVGDFARQLPR